MQSKWRNDTKLKYLMGISSAQTDINGTLFRIFSNLTTPFESDSAYDYPQLELPYGSQISLICVYTITIILAVVGNLTAVFVLHFGNRSRTGLNKFLMNLAIADLLMACFCMPFTFTNTMLGHWIFGAAMCPVALFAQVTSVASSIFTNTTIGIDRWVMQINTDIVVLYSDTLLL